jgi:hypothetical protein
MGIVLDGMDIGYVGLHSRVVAKTKLMGQRHLWTQLLQQSINKESDAWQAWGADQYKAGRI